MFFATAFAAPAIVPIVTVAPILPAYPVFGFGYDLIAAAPLAAVPAAAFLF